MMTTHPSPRDANSQLAVFVGGGADALAVVETTLEGRGCEVEFVDADDEPYATIAALRPDLVVVSLDLAELAGFQLLTMLRLDQKQPAFRCCPISKTPTSLRLAFQVSIPTRRRCPLCRFRVSTATEAQLELLPYAPR